MDYSHLETRGIVVSHALRTCENTRQVCLLTLLHTLPALIEVVAFRAEGRRRYMSLGLEVTCVRDYCEGYDNSVIVFLEFFKKVSQVCFV